MGGGGKGLQICKPPRGAGVPINFSKGYAESKYKLFELDEDILQELTRPDGSLRIKGGAEDEAVLCTAASTYVLRLAESSNSMLLLPKA
eukprot:3536683-Prymnesium_polylepis.1